MTENTKPVGTQQVLMVAGLAVLAWWVFSPIATLLYTLFLALLVAYVLDPVLDWGEEKRIPRTITICGILASLTVFSLGFAFWIIPPLAEHIHEAVTRLSSLSEEKLPEWIAWLEAVTGITIERAGDVAKTQIAKYGPWCSKPSGNGPRIKRAPH